MSIDPRRSASAFYNPSTPAPVPHFQQPLQPRPSSSSSAQVRRAPYPAPGSPYSKPGPTPRKRNPLDVLKTKWANEFKSDGPFFDGGVKNRLTLSIKSGIPSEIDWALEKLVRISSIDPDLLKFTEYHGLLDALIGLIEAFLDWRSKSNQLGELYWWDKHEEKENLGRRACEAALCIRNISSIDPTPLNKSRRVLRMITDVLEEGERAGSEGDELTEMRLYLLDVLELLGKDTSLALSSRHTFKSTRIRTNDPSSPSVRLYPLLVSLTRSTDRALVLAAYRSLVSLAHSESESSKALTATSTYPLIYPRTSTFHHPHPIDTAIELLPLADSELRTLLLDYIYEHTLFPSNAIQLCIRPDLLTILRMIAGSLHVSAQREQLTLLLPMPQTEAEHWFRSLRPRHESLGRAQIRVLDSGLRARSAEVARLVGMPEPERSFNWMSGLFEAHAASEITQVSLWNAYKTEFDHYGTPENPIMPAGDLIKLTQQAFATAVPLMADGKFLIRGVRIRSETIAMNQHPCKWFGCSAPIGSTSIESLYSHLYHFHLLPLSSPPTSSPETAHACHWIDCNYNTTLSSDNPLVSINELAVHLRSHLYTTSGPITTYLPTPRPPATAIMTHERYHAEVSKQDEAEITGIGFIACLVIRNIARLVKDMLIKDGVIAATSIADPAPTNEDDVDKNQVDEATTMRSRSLFELMSLASRSDADDPLSLALESQVDYTAAKRNAMEGLEGIEEKLVMATVESHHLGRVLGEVLLVTTECAKRKRGG